MSLTSGYKDPHFAEMSNHQEDLDENTSTETAPKSVTVPDSDGRNSYSIRPCSPQQQISPEDLPSGVGEQIHELALQITRASRASINIEDISNPFIGSSDPALDPQSDSFNFKAWFMNLGRMVSHEKDRSPHPNAGVSFRNLNVHGFGSLTDYQKDFGNVLLEGVGWIQKMTGKGQNRIQILKEFDGLVKEGEILVVLGSPGR
jgi:ATP-binding cassette subfamily G (WHITE) protein 2 (PDR)